MANFSISPENKKIVAEYFDKRKKAIGLSKYSVGEAFAHGGMAIVYELKTRSGHVDYVLRVSQEQQSPYSNDIFNVREVNILKELKRRRQPNVVLYLDAFVVDIPGQQQYFCSVMKKLIPLNSGYCDKRDYREIAVRLGNDFLPLLQSLADEGILHRDIKPGNIFFDKDFRNTEGFMLGDFGIAKVDDRSSATPAGTDITIAPEIKGFDDEIKGDRSKSDMYSLGIVMYYYLNDGVYPSNKERLKEHPDKSPFPEPRYGSKRLKQLVIKATQYNPRDRFDSPQAMLRELQKCDEYTTFIEGRVQSDKDTQIPEKELMVKLAKKDAEIEELKRAKASNVVPIAAAEAVEAAVANERSLERIRQAKPLVYTSFLLGMVSYLLIVISMIYIRIISNNADIIQQYSSVEIINKVMQLGNSWAQLLFSTTFSGIILFALIITHLCNGATWRQVIASSFGSLVAQSLYVLFYSWIKPPFNTGLEQIILFSAVYFLNLTAYSTDDLGLKELFGESSVYSVLRLLPSFTLLLPGWCGIVITAFFNLLAIIFLFTALSEYTDKEKKLKSLTYSVTQESVQPNVTSPIAPQKSKESVSKRSQNNIQVQDGKDDASELPVLPIPYDDEDDASELPILPIPYDEAELISQAKVRAAIEASKLVATQKIQESQDMEKAIKQAEEAERQRLAAVAQAERAKKEALDKEELAKKAAAQAAQAEMATQAALNAIYKAGKS